MGTSMDPVDTTTKRTLVEIVQYLDSVNANMVRTATAAELASYELPSEYTGLPVYKVIRTYLTHQHKQNNDEMYMVFVANGAIYFTDGDVLEDYILDEDGFFDEKPYNYDAIFEAFFLNGGQDIASFAGFFFKKA
jgi:hypothetical protein